MFQKEQLELLKQFVSACKANPSILHVPDLKFFKDWLLALGAKLPDQKPNDDKPKAKPAPEPTLDDDESDDEDMEEPEEVKEEEKESEDEELVESDVDIEELDGHINEPGAGYASQQAFPRHSCKIQYISVAIFLPGP